MGWILIFDIHICISNITQIFETILRFNLFQWVGPIDDLEAEFDAIDVNGGGQILFNEFVDWATAKNLDIEEDDD